jgi:beta-N-acetylhexosaminidase
MKSFMWVFAFFTLIVQCLTLNGMQKIEEDPRMPMIVCCDGVTLSSGEVELLQKNKPVGVILFGGNCRSEEQIMELTQQIHSLGLLVCVDAEGRTNNKLKKIYPLEKAASDFEHSSAKDIYDYHYKVAKHIKRLGIDIMFGPVTDVCDPTVSFLGSRVFSGDADRVAACAYQVVMAYQDAGVLPVIKHLPGHGKAVEDSHKYLPIVEAFKSELTECDIRASRLLIDNLCKKGRPLPACMTSHVIYRDIDPNFPGTLSSAIINGVIRGEIGIGDGIIFSDAMHMKALEKFLHKSDYKHDAYRGFLAAGGDVAILDSITDMCSNPVFYERKDPLIMSKILRAIETLPRKN